MWLCLRGGIDTPTQNQAWCGLDTPPRPHERKSDSTKEEKEKILKVIADSKIAFTHEQVLKECKRTSQLKEAKPIKGKNKKEKHERVPGVHRKAHAVSGMLEEKHAPQELAGKEREERV